MSEADAPESEDLREFIQNNPDLITRVLVSGDSGGQAFALAALANGATDADIEEIQSRLEDLKSENGG